MLDQLLCYLLINFIICVKGDYYIDDYYIVEDIGIVFGQVLVQVFGDKKGINCYGECILLMDDV